MIYIFDDEQIRLICQKNKYGPRSSFGVVKVIHTLKSIGEITLKTNVIYNE